MPRAGSKKNQRSGLLHKAQKKTRDYANKPETKSNALFAFLLALCISGQLFYINYIFHHSVTLLKAAIDLLIGFVLVFSFFFMVSTMGGRFYKGDILVSSWLAWFIAGAWLLFWGGAAWFGSLYPGGIGAAAVWGAILICTWGIKNVIERNVRSISLTRDAAKKRKTYK